MGRVGEGTVGEKEEGLPPDRYCVVGGGRDVGVVPVEVGVFVPGHPLSLVSRNSINGPINTAKRR